MASSMTKVPPGTGKKRFVMLALAFLVLTVAGTMGASYLYSTRTPQISVGDQSLSGTKVMVSEAVIPMDGFIVIHPVDDKGAAVLSDSLGVAPIKAGTSVQVPVDLTTAVKLPLKVAAVLHADTGMKGKYEYAAASTDKDGPVLNSGRTVTATFTIR